MKFIGNFIVENYINFILILSIIIIISLYIVFPSRWRWITLLAFSTIITFIIVFDFFKLYQFGTKYIPDTNSKSFNVNNNWPPVENKCPDFFSEHSDSSSSGVKCQLQNEQLLKRVQDTCNIYNEEDAIKEYIVIKEKDDNNKDISINDITNNNGNYFIDDTQYEISLSQKYCAKQKWAERCNLSWDGITNVNFC